MKRRDLNPNLGKAYDLLHSIGIPFYNDPLEREGGGRSLKPYYPVDLQTHRKLVKLADRVRNCISPAPEDAVRYHFFTVSIKATPMKDWVGMRDWPLGR